METLTANCFSSSCSPSFLSLAQAVCRASAPALPARSAPTRPFLYDLSGLLPAMVPLEHCPCTSVMNFEGTSHSAAGSTGKKIRGFNTFTSPLREHPRWWPLPHAARAARQARGRAAHGNAPGSAALWFPVFFVSYLERSLNKNSHSSLRGDASS